MYEPERGGYPVAGTEGEAWLESRRERACRVQSKKGIRVYAGPTGSIIFSRRAGTWRHRGRHKSISGFVEAHIIAMEETEPMSRGCRCAGRVQGSDVAANTDCLEK